MKEAISRYEALTAYTTIKLGVGIDFNLYMTDEKYRTLVNENFNEITPGNEMKQSSLMKADGTLDFTSADNVMEALQTAGLTVYGHTLVWHSQQRAGYLNSLIAPTVIPGPAGSNLLDLSGLSDGSFSGGWGRPNQGAGIQIVEGEGLASTSKAVKLISSSSSANEWDLQLETPDVAIVAGHTYEISFYIKSDKTGSGRISFDSNITNSYPWKDWYGTGSASGSFETSGVWQQVKFTLDDFKEGATAFKMYFDLGKLPDVTYYMDVDNILIIDLDAAPAEYNYLENGDLETGELTPLTVSNAGAGITVAAGAKFEGSYGIQAIAGASSANEWDLQFQTPEIVLETTKTYTMSFWIKSDMEGQGRISFPGFSNEWPWVNWDGSGAAALFNTSASWMQVSFDFTPEYSDGVNAVKFSFDLGKLAGVTYFIDNIKVVEKPAAELSGAPGRKAPIIVDKTMEEKIAILEPVLHNYVTAVASHFAGKVVAWDVVNEPMNENGTVRTGEENLKSTDTFYWMYYLGKDYAVKTFKWAREADPNAKLFINDYNLESASGSKLDGLIEYVQYIESQGAVVDGIGTQVHLNINYADTNAIASMFQKLAGTGKLIKISELDIAINTDAPSVAQQEEQAKLYQMIVTMYKKYIPEAQQYGITVWGVSDNAAEHEYWLEGDAPNLWDADYARKHAYKGFADGLAGKDVSADFSGELQY